MLLPNAAYLYFIYLIVLSVKFIADQSETFQDGPGLLSH